MRRPLRQQVRDQAVRQFFPVEELARDERFYTISIRERMGDPRDGPDG